MSDNKIPPRPWRVDMDGDVIDSTGLIVATALGDDSASLIVRLVNAQPEVVEALHEAREQCVTIAYGFPSSGIERAGYRARDAIDRALALLQGEGEEGACPHIVEAWCPCTAGIRSALEGGYQAIGCQCDTGECPGCVKASAMLQEALTALGGERKAGQGDG